MKNSVKAILSLIALTFGGCSTVQATGEGVQDIGKGAGRGLSKASQAVGDAGSAIADGAGDILTGTGRAIEKGSKRTEQKGY